ncbi:protein phosphatase [Nocardioides daedukensis]|uniref:Protein phosphatase n=1 Tax=Nocardioides daedukensis TaxID=634462 RepID=A0A7Y9UTT3_9ACTN|nr:protein phosphatase 2C domain-containing protein [Nocardioides daedukensis]NYG59099.1 protein phosphatase [Nocardioides daedukensis]
MAPDSGSVSAVILDVCSGAASDVGAVREENQDAYLVRDPVFLVADGMGGHRDGRLAADLVVAAFRDAPWSRWATPQVLGAAVAAAGQEVRALAPGDGRAAGVGAPGATVSGVALADHDGVPSWLVFNIGDSRTYLLRGETLSQVSVDHSELQGLIEQGLSTAEAELHGDAHAITKAIGAGLHSTPDPDQWLVPARVGDRILICSDGLTGELSDPLITALLMAYEDAGAAAEELVAAAVRSGGRDNVTAVVIDAVTVAAASPELADWTDPLGGHTRPNVPAPGLGVDA